MTQIILASASPRRRELIHLLGLTVRVATADVDEESVTHPDPATNAVETALLKARAVAAGAGNPAIVIGSDTIVALGELILGKPVDSAEARAMLRRLRGRTHHVHTGIALIDTGSGRTVTDVASVPVPMRPYGDDEIAAYVATGDPLDKAGAYAIQHPVFRPVAHLDDCYAAVVGLPLCHLARALAQLGVALAADVPTACRRHTSYDCRVFPRYLTTNTPAA